MQTETTKNLLERAVDSLHINPNHKWLSAGLLVAVILLLVSAGLPWRKLKDNRGTIGVLIVIAMLFLTILIVDESHRWQWIVGLLPALLVCNQAFYLWLYHPKKANGKEKSAPKQSGVGGLGGLDPTRRKGGVLAKESYYRAEKAVDRHFNLKTLVLRYGLPAMLLALAGIVIIDVLLETSKYFSLMPEPTGQLATNRDRMLLGVRLGSVGAYVYVLLDLGRRTFRHDITTASAMWCLVTLILGPVLAGAVAVLWQLKPHTEGEWWGSGVVLFFTGFAPRRVIAAIEQAAVQLLKIGPTTIVETRMIPLTKIRGISPQIEDRLSEEGITDVNALAWAEPVRLVRNTSFDMRQILTWIDEAIMVVTLPKSWEAFEEQGISGAIDLAWYYEQLIDENLQLRKNLDDKPLSELAKAGKLENENLFSTIRRLYEDRQVQYIWALYDHYTEFSGEQAQSDGPEPGFGGSRGGGSAGASGGRQAASLSERVKAIFRNRRA
jgi:hypothetical protein